MVSQEVTSEPAGKTKKPTTWYLIPPNKHPGKQGCDCQLCNHKISNPCKHRMLTIHPSVFVHVQCISFQSFFVAGLFAVIRQLLLVSLPVISIHFCSFTSNSSVCLICLSDYSVYDYLFIQCNSLFWYWNCIPGILIPQNINHPASQ
jgi:hypothetical protein